MHKFLLLGLLPAILSAQTEWKNISITPARPKPGETIRLEYNWLAGPLKNADKLEIALLEYHDKTAEFREIDLRSENGRLAGSCTTSPGALAAAILIKSGERYDNNSRQGYFIPMCDAAGKPLPEALAAEAALLSEWSRQLDVDNQPARGLEWLNTAFSGRPDLKKKYATTLTNTIMRAKRGDEGKKEAMVVLEEMENDPGLSESDLNWLINTYNRLKENGKVAAAKDKLRAKFPEAAARQDKLRAISNEVDLAKREGMIDAYKKEYPPANEEEFNTIDQQYAQVLARYGNQKNWQFFTPLAAKVSPAQRARVYNDIAWDLAEKNTDLDRALSLAAEATAWARTEIMAPSVAKPANITRREWDERRDFTFAMYADTYAFLLDKSGDPLKAAEYQAEAVKINDFGNAEFNERFTDYLEKAGSPDLRYQLEGFILKGAATEKMKEQFKKYYMAEDKSATGHAAYLAGLERIAYSNRKSELLKNMLEDPAPAFSLKNLKGEQVSLEALRGKVVVVDFWATWCGPCKSSFPGMQQAVDKYQSDPNVAFVFVDTWENGNEKEKNAEDFIKSKGYTFNVLMDNDNRVVSSFGVSGIPTKFIVDKSGKIRFKSVGYAGSTDALVEELSMMIDVAKGAP
jgi:thiol-disulfide isomerase/thioredoxin